jgi:hypothetical protein
MDGSRPRFDNREVNIVEWRNDNRVSRTGGGSLQHFGSGTSRKSSQFPVDAISSLDCKSTSTELRTDLYGALQLHARASIATEVAHKLVFVVAAAESIFLRNASEPIQKNLGERMAFLVGQNVVERKKIIQNVDDFYGIRSGLIHHGKEIQDQQRDIVDEFFVNVWFSFVTLMRNGERWKTRNEMFLELEERKLA